MAGVASARQGNWKEITVGPQALGTYGQDAAATHNNSRAAVRHANPVSNETVVSVWQLTNDAPNTPLAKFGGIQNGVALKSGIRTDLGDPINGYWPADRIELTNVIGISTGCGLSGSLLATPGLQSDETYIEAFDIGATTPDFLRQFVVSPPSTTSQARYDCERAGYANDIAITRDGAWAVINSDNWIHLVNLANAKDPNALIGFNIGAFDYSGETPVAWQWPTTPNQAVDSIALTNDRAIVTTARQRRDDPTINSLQGVWTTWVYIIDLTTSPPSIVLQHDLAPPNSWTIVGNDDDRPHDIAVTPHLELLSGVAKPLCVVSTNHSVAVFDIENNVFLEGEFDGTEWRTYQIQVDSVEMTGQRAVVISDFIPTAAAVPVWRIDIFALDSSQGFVALPNGVQAAYTGTARGTPEDPVDNRSHDLLLDKDFDKALVRTSFDNVVFPSIQAPPPPVPFSWTFPSPNGSDAHAYRLFQGTNRSSFSSDSVVISTALGGVLRAATIGSKQNVSGEYQGFVDLIQLAPSISLSQIPIFPDPNSSLGCVPLDLAIAQNKEDVVVRCADPEFQGTSGSALEADLIIASLIPGLGIAVRHPGHGYVLALDSLAVPQSGFINTTRFTLSVSQETYFTFLPPGFDFQLLAK